MGLQVILSGNFSVDFFLGGGLRFSLVDNKPGLDFYYPERGYTGIVPKIGFDLGVSFDNQNTPINSNIKHGTIHAFLFCKKIIDVLFKTFVTL